MQALTKPRMEKEKRSTELHGNHVNKSNNLHACAQNIEHTALKKRERSHPSCQRLFDSTCYKGRDQSESITCCSAPMLQLMLPLRLLQIQHIVNEPMDLQTVLIKLQTSAYLSPLDFRDDMRLIWSNCAVFHQIGSQVRRMAEHLSHVFEQSWQASGLEELWQQRLVK